MANAVRRRAVLGWIGIVAGVVSLGIALLLPRILPMVNPPPPIEQSIVERAKSLRDRAMAIVKGTESKPPAVSASRPADWRAYGSIVALALGYLAFVAGILGFVRREDTRVVAGSALLGVCGLVFEQPIAAVVMLLAVLLVALVIDRRA